ncbi:MAG TPA: hypothetical protein VE984_05510 [Gaiellaceae bacterium]|nr:hypothetical protein [Gaiellaceae bacterium]
MQLDEEKLEALRSWGERLRQTGGEESAAVGRAILMLVEEIDRLHIELWHARIRPQAAAPADTETPSEPVEEDEVAVSTSLQARLQRMLRRDVPAEPREQSEPEPDPSDERERAAQAWIAALRRQK